MPPRIPWLIALFYFLLLSFATCRGADSDGDNPGQTELGNEKKASMLLRFVGGPQNEPLAGMKVKITSGDSDKQKSVGSHTTDETGTIKVSLPPAFYELELSSDKELPYLPVDMLWNKGSRGPSPDLSLNVTKTGVEKCLAGKRRDDGYEANVADGLPRITYTLLPACELTLRAVDVETGEGLPGAEFYKENDAKVTVTKSFEVNDINHDHKMPIPDAGPSLGGISSNVLLKPNGETTVELKLSDWATITRPGSYRVYVERTLKLFPVKAQDGDRIVWSDAPETEQVKASCDFDVVAADEQSAAEGQEFKTYKQKIHNTEVSFEMVAISGGEFTMGSSDGELGRGVDEGPQHRVRVQSFWMGKCEVTWDEFELWLLQTRLQPAQRKGTDRSPLDTKADAVTRPTRPYADLSNGMGTRGCPAICISQHAAKKYCEWLSAKTGLYYRLPTEAEWEYACRAGTTTAYSFGDDPSRLDAYAWHDGNCDVDGVKKYHPVGLKQPNPWGLHDMHGNVAEWVQDKYEAGFYKASPANQVAESPLCIARLEYPRVTRGGSWMSEPSLTRSAARQASTDKWKESDPQAPKSAWYITDAPFIGFRVVRPLRPPTQDERKSQHLDAVVPTDVVERRLPGD